MWPTHLGSTRRDRRPRLAQKPVACAHDLYDACRHAFGHLPPTEMMKAARCQEEASFYMAVFDFFLQQRQRELVKEGVF